MAFDLERILLNLIPMVLSLSVHEYAHALVADGLGDDTPRQQGRLTLSPLEHYDIFGTFIIPAVSTLLGGMALIGWARPVEFRPERMTRRLSMRQATALVAVAGPLANLVLAILAVAAMAVLQRVQPQWLSEHGVGALLSAMFLLNIALCVFNLLPLPPLDGSRLLPRSADGFKAAVAPYSFLLILIALNIGPVREVFFAMPVRTLANVVGGVFGMES